MGECLSDYYIGKDELAFLRQLINKTHKVVLERGKPCLTHPFSCQLGKVQVFAGIPMIYKDTIVTDRNVLMTVEDRENQVLIQTVFFGPTLGFDMAVCFDDGCNYSSGETPLNKMTDVECGVFSSYLQEFLGEAGQLRWYNRLLHRLGPRLSF